MKALMHMIEVLQEQVAALQATLAVLKASQESADERVRQIEGQTLHLKNKGK